MSFFFSGWGEEQVDEATRSAYHGITAIKIVFVIQATHQRCGFHALFGHNNHPFCIFTGLK